MTTQLKKSEIEFLRSAATYFEGPSSLIAITNLIGRPLEAAIESLPGKCQAIVANATQNSLEFCLSGAIRTLGSASVTAGFESGRANSPRTNWGHKIATAITGGVAGAFGLAALPFELPITTTIMLRGICATANDYGHDLDDLKIRFECLSVFALGSASKHDDAVESAYFVSRIAMSQAINDAAKWAAKKTAEEVAQAITEKSAPAIIRLIAKIAAQFQVVVTQEVVAKVLPGISIATGALINAAFTGHFNHVANFHFGIKALESRYGVDAVRAIYDANMPQA